MRSDPLTQRPDQHEKKTKARTALARDGRSGPKLAHVRPNVPKYVGKVVVGEWVGGLRVAQSALRLRLRLRQY